MTIDQATRTGIVDWRSFSIGARNSVTFHNGRGATLNIVKGANVSRIAGELHATGSVYLINRAGVAITSKGRVDTQGNFAASSRGADRDAFSANGRLHLTGHGKGNVVDAGQITARNVSLIAGGTVRVPGQIAASRNVETSGARIRIAGASIAAKAWLIDPKNLTVTSAAATTIENSLNHGTNVTLRTTAAGAVGPGTRSDGAGDITIAAPITWSSTAMLAIRALNSVFVNQEIHLTGRGTLKVGYGTDGTLAFGSAGNATFDRTLAKFFLRGVLFKLVGNISALASAVASNPGGSFALAGDIDASGTTYHATPVGTHFTGTFDGLGHTIANLKIDDATSAYVGLFGLVDGTLENLNLTGANVVALGSSPNAGVLAGGGHAAIQNVHLSGTLTGAQGGTYGGAIGLSELTITNAHSSVAVTAAGGISQVGGLAGSSSGTITGSSATGTVIGGDDNSVGGLAGFSNGTVTNSFAKGRVVLGNNADGGGLVGSNGGTITGSHATGAVMADGQTNAGGLVGTNIGTVQDSYASGTATSQANSTSGGLVGDNEGNIIDSHASGAAKTGGPSQAGGLVGENMGSITGSFATGLASAGDSAASGGLVGLNKGGSISLSHASGNATLTAGDVGGLVGANQNGGTITHSFATGNASTGYTGHAGGLVGNNDSGTVSRSFSTGSATGTDASVGGFAGRNNGSIVNSYARGAANGADTAKVGGFVGFNDTAGTITLAYSAGFVFADASSTLGGFAGSDSNVAANHFLHDYWDRSTSGVNQTSHGVGNVPSAPGVTGLTGTQLKGGLPAGFSATIWKELSTVNSGLPFLIGTPPP